MADCYYEKILIEACNLLVKTTSTDIKFVQSVPIPILLNAFETLADHYIKYIQVANKFNLCYEEMIHPQVRNEIQKVYNMVLGRILEIKHEMVDIDKSDYQFLDNIIISNNLTRWDLDLNVPSEYRIKRKEQMDFLERKYERILDDLERLRLTHAFEEGEISDENVIIAGRLSELSDISVEKISKFSKASTSDVKKQPVIPLSLIGKDLEVLSAIQMIQNHERARRTRLRLNIELEHIRTLQNIISLIYTPLSEEVKLEKALIIQRHWARYRGRRKTKYRQDKLRLLLDIYVPSYRDKSYIPKIKDVEDERREKQIETIKAMQDIAYIYKLRMEKKRDIIQGDLEMELMHYVEEWYEITRKLDFPNLPEWPGDNPRVPPFNYIGIPQKIPEKLYDELAIEQYEVINKLFGHIFEPLVGSELITAFHWIPAKLWATIKIAIDNYNKRSKGKKPQPAKPKEKKDKKQEKALKKKQLEALRRMGYVPKESKYIDDLYVVARQAWTDFCQNEYIKLNRKQKFNHLIVESEMCKDMNREIRLAADEKIRSNLVELQKAFLKDKGKKYKPKRGRGRGKPKQRVRKMKDTITEEEKWELFEFMAQNKIMTTYQPTFFKDLVGEYSFTNFELRKIFLDDPSPSLGDIYQVVKEYCVLTLANKDLRSTTPLIKSVLLVGPNYYTYPIIDAICTEASAILFRFEPLSVAEKFEDSQSLIYHITKVPKLFEPAVIHIEDAEKPFYKKVPPIEAEKQPKFMAPVFKKLLKAINTTDRVLLLGTSEKPWEANKKKMLKAFAKVIPIPDLDYHTLSKAWKDTIMKYHGVARDFDYSVLNTVSNGLKLENIKQITGEIMTPKRIISLKSNPLKHEEFEILLPAPQIERSFWQWAQGTVPLFVKRMKMLKAQKKILEEMQRRKLLEEKRKLQEEKKKKK